MAPRLAADVWGGKAMADVPVAGAAAERPPSTWDADEAITRLFAAHYRSLVRLAVLLLREPGPAEDVVQDAYVALHGRWRALREADKALAYLRQSVVNRSRSALRHRGVVERFARTAAPPGQVPSAEAGALTARENLSSS